MCIPWKQVVGFAWVVCCHCYSPTFRWAPLLQVTCNMPVLVVWYDINCRFAAYFLHWAAQHPVLLTLVKATMFPLQVFHKYSHRQAALTIQLHAVVYLQRASNYACWHLGCLFHCKARQAVCYVFIPTVLWLCIPSLPCSAACQEKNDGLYMQGTGLQYNEPNETFWAYLGKQGDTTQVRCRWLRMGGAGN